MIITDYFSRHYTSGLRMLLKELFNKLRLKVRAYRIKNIISQRGYEVRLDKPKSAVDGPYTLIVGVLFVPYGSKIDAVEIRTEQHSTIKVLLHARPDLTRDLRGIASHGFSAILENRNDQQITSCALVVKTDGATIEHPIQIEFRQKQHEAFLVQKQKKLNKIQDTLQCPSCAAGVERGRLTCTSCNRPHAENELFYDFRTDQLRSELNAAGEGNISAHNYEKKAKRLIEKYPDGLILDNGCGFREMYYSNVVNFEIAEYPTTDVLGVGEELPFKNDSFDAVFSLSVLEHVRDPFKCVSEMVRVLKPGGDLFVAVPFLQPFHGYPNHYYNMTSSGLKHLFDGLADIDEIGVSRAGHPLWSMQWILANYANGLSEKESNDFKNLRVGDIISPTKALEQKMLSQLDDKKREELASFNYLLGKKPLT